MFANLDAGCGGLNGTELTTVGVTFFQIPQVDGARSAAHPQDDQALVGFLEILLSSSQTGDKLGAGTSQERKPGNMFQEVPAVGCHEVGHLKFLDALFDWKDSPSLSHERSAVKGRVATRIHQLDA